MLELNGDDVFELPGADVETETDAVPLEDDLSVAEVDDEEAVQIDMPSGDEVFIVVTQVGANTFGIIVDRVFDTEEIVVKPVAPILRDIPVYSGNTILGDGSVIMILDPNGIVSSVGKMDRDPDDERQDQGTTGHSD